MSNARSALLPVLLLLAAAATAGNAPEANYMIHCQGCHLPDGGGHPPAVPSLVTDMGKFLRVDGGRAYLVQVPGTAYSPLADADVASLLNWMLETYARASAPAGFTLYTTEEVAAYRAEKLLDPAARRDALLATLGE